MKQWGPLYVFLYIYNLKFPSKHAVYSDRATPIAFKM